MSVKHIDTAIEAYYRLLTRDYKIDLLGELCKRYTIYNSKLVYQKQTNKFDKSLFDYKTTFTAFAKIIDSFYDTIKDIINNNDIDDNKKHDIIMDLIKEGQHRYIYKSRIMFVGDDDKYSGSIIQQQEHDFTMFFKNVLLFNESINTDTVRCIIRQHIKILLNKKQRLEKPWTPIEINNIYHARSYVNKTIEQINTITDDIMCLQTILDDLFILHCYKDEMITNDVFKKLSEISIYLK